MRQRPERVWLGYCAAVALLLAGASTHAVAGDVMVRGSGPKAVLDAYQRAMEKGLSDPDLAIYSERSKRMMAQRGVSEAQMRNTADSLRRCSMDSVKEPLKDSRELLVVERGCSQGAERRAVLAVQSSDVTPTAFAPSDPQGRPKAPLWTALAFL